GHARRGGCGGGVAGEGRRRAVHERSGAEAAGLTPASPTPVGEGDQRSWWRGDMARSLSSVTPPPPSVVPLPPSCARGAAEQSPPSGPRRLTVSCWVRGSFTHSGWSDAWGG